MSQSSQPEGRLARLGRDLEEVFQAHGHIPEGHAVTRDFDPFPGIKASGHQEDLLSPYAIAIYRAARR